MKRSKTVWLVLGIPVLATLVYGQFGRPLGQDLVENRNGQALFETYDAVKRYYLDPPAQSDLDQILEGGIRGMVGALDDQFTSYMPPESAQARSENLSGEFFGIGVQISAASIEGKGARIVNVYRNSPAAKAGVRIGDQIVAVGEEDVREALLDEIVSKIRGPQGSQVEVTLQRADGSVITVPITRDRVQMDYVTSAMLPGQTGYVAIETFEGLQVSRQLASALDKLKSQGATKLVLDLRDNGGGLLDQGCAVADAFLNQGVIVYTKERNTTRVACEASPGMEWQGPMVVLTNGNSASASEIVAGALQDLNRAQVVGEKTFGKGVGQREFPLSNGGTLRLVTFEWLTPDKSSIQAEGVHPDLVVADSRYPQVLSFQGGGVEAGAQISLTVNGQTYQAQADEKGGFKFVDLPEPLAQSDVQGEALVDSERDAILRKALETLNTAVVSE